MASSLLHDLRTPSRLIPALSSGLVVGLLVVVVQLSLATLIFSGPLAPFAPAAAGLTLFGSFAMGLAVALGAGFPVSICLPEDAPTAILATVSAAIASGLAASAEPRAIFITVGAAMALSTALTGLLFLFMGRFGLGNLMRYMPYPVVAGFMAGIGWLLVQGSFAIVVGTPLGFHAIPELLSPGALLRMAPAAALMLALLFGMRRWRSPFTLPGVLGCALGGFALYMALSGASLAEADKAGLLLGGLAEGTRLWPVFTPADIALVRWDAILAQLPQLLTIPLVSAISVLLIASGIETAANHDLDLKRELYVNGLANLLAAPGAPPAGYTALSFSMMGPKTGSDSRLVGISSALIVGGTLAFGTSLLSYFPRFVLGGMALFLGVATLLDWVAATRRQVSPVEYCLILSILCVVAFGGFLTGVAYGLAMAIIIFVIKYSRLPVIWRQADALSLSSRRRRSVPDQYALRAQGREIRVLQVMGYMFFGSANVIYRAAAAHLSSGPAPGFLVLDFAEADGFDSSAVNSFQRLLQRCASSGCSAAFAAPPPGFETQLRATASQEMDSARFFPDLDRALEWCEDQVLARRDEGGQEELFDLVVDDVLSRLEESERFEALVERLGPYLESRRATAGESILRQGGTVEGVWLFLSGQAEETSGAGEGAPLRLRTLRPGDMSGLAERNGLPSATGIVAVTDCSTAFLSAHALQRLKTGDPALTVDFYSQYAAQLESRLTDSSPPRR